ncbi:MAG: TIGR02452 family protein [Hungatella sp.]|jgi:uncharacterized protein (TIGR02452 family)|nr:TIGR02452 family protein [Hungatella sp.]MCI9635009.1 TIGR02452 family protein [Hungatella sp.]
MWIDYIDMIKETIQISEQGYYIKNNETKHLKTSASEREQSILLSPETLCQIAKSLKEITPSHRPGTCEVNMSNKDSFQAAQDMAEHYHIENTRNILVLNFANPVCPGGGVLKGAKAQEEDLCRKSTLYLSLRTEEARAMYEYNQALNDYRSSNYMLLSPNVEIFRDSDGGFLNETMVAGVLTAAAPIAPFGINDEVRKELLEILRTRIQNILHAAAFYNYQYLVLGAWGCGAFGNDAAQVAQLFYEELQNFQRPSGSIDSRFRGIVFAVLNPSKGGYNYKYFEKYFDGFSLEPV